MKLIVKKMVLKACYSQGETIDELMENMKEVITMCLEELEDFDRIYNLFNNFRM